MLNQTNLLILVPWSEIELAGSSLPFQRAHDLRQRWCKDPADSVLVLSTTRLL